MAGRRNYGIPLDAPYEPLPPRNPSSENRYCRSYDVEPCERQVAQPYMEFHPIVSHQNEDYEFMRAQLASLESSLEEKNLRIVRLESSLEEKNSHIVSLQSSIAEKNSHIEGLQNILWDKDFQIARLQSRLDERELHNASLYEIVRDLGKCSMISPTKPQFQQSSGPSHSFTVDNALYAHDPFVVSNVHAHTTAKKDKGKDRVDSVVRALPHIQNPPTTTKLVDAKPLPSTSSSVESLPEVQGRHVVRKDAVVLIPPSYKPSHSCSSRPMHDAETDDEKNQ
jgi:hypothetical protein